ncbi:hypothetical protein EG329_001671 [Mollisiaceae sp. DMI_Dod_QoI]|nr:hypothetical protein EG329_001671 [Helotiales sp. DMI_Dod_QoI]
MATSNTLSSSEPPPRYSRVVNPNPPRYAVTNGQVVLLTPLPSYPTFQPQPLIFPQPLPVPQAYLPTYPGIHYQHTFIPTLYSYNYPYPISNAQMYATPAPIYPQPQSLFYQTASSAFPTGMFGYQPQFYVPPPPPGYATLPGTNYAIPKEWLTGAG